MSLVTKMAPDFTAEAVLADGSIDKFTLSNWRGKYVILFFYPLDFTFVCPTEILAFDRALANFLPLNTEVVSVSVDSIYAHYAWRNTDRRHGGIGPVSFPMVSDMSRKISTDYGVLLNDSLALRGLFLIDKEGIVRHEVVNDLPLGRSVDETLRMVKALQFYEAYGDVCPADWHEGDAAVHPNAAGVKAYIAKHH